MRRAFLPSLLGALFSSPGSAPADDSTGPPPERRRQVEALLKRRVVLLEGAMDDTTTTNAIAQLMYLESTGSERVSLVIDSSGGPVGNGFALLETVRTLKAPVSTFCAGRCGGLAAVVLAAGTKGQRHVAPGSTIELGRMTAPPGTPAETSTKARRALQKALVDGTGRSAEEVDRHLLSGGQFDAGEAIARGLADRIAPPPTRP